MSLTAKQTHFSASISGTTGKQNVVSSSASSRYINKVIRQHSESQHVYCKGSDVYRHYCEHNSDQGKAAFNNGLLPVNKKCRSVHLL
jgi:hypothetical protein